MNCSDMLKALDMAAEMSGCGTPVGRPTDRNPMKLRIDLGPTREY